MAHEFLLLYIQRVRLLQLRHSAFPRVKYSQQRSVIGNQAPVINQTLLRLFTLLNWHFQWTLHTQTENYGKAYEKLTSIVFQSCPKEGRLSLAVSGR